MTRGFKRWHQFTRIAVVTESKWLRAAIIMFTPFFPIQTQLFKLAKLGAAKAVITGKDMLGV